MVTGTADRKKTTVPVMIRSGHVKTIRVSNFVYIHPPVLEISPKNPVFDGFLVFLQLGVVGDTWKYYTTLLQCKLTHSKKNFWIPSTRSGDKSENPCFDVFSTIFRRLIGFPAARRCAWNFLYSLCHSHDPYLCIKKSTEPNWKILFCLQRCGSSD